MSPETLRKLIKTATSGLEPEVNKPLLLRQAQVYENLDHYYELREKINTKALSAKDCAEYNHLLADMEPQALILDKKINARWSINRMREEHSNWTHQIMEIEQEYIEDVEYFPENLFADLPVQYKVIRTRKELFKEGVLMHHCVYSSYESRIHSGRYLAVIYDDGIHRATIGMRPVGKYTPRAGVPPTEVEVHQAYGKWNSEISDELKDKFVADLTETDLSNKLFNEYFKPKNVSNTLPGEYGFETVPADGILGFAELDFEL